MEATDGFHTATYRERDTKKENSDRLIGKQQKSCPRSDLSTNVMLNFHRNTRTDVLHGQNDGVYMASDDRKHLDKSFDSLLFTVADTGLVPATGAGSSSGTHLLGQELDENSQAYGLPTSQEEDRAYKCARW